MEVIMRNLSIPTETKGEVYLHSMPARYETWDELCQALKEKGITTVVCLTSFEEIEKLSPAYAKAFNDQMLPFEKVTTAISDFGIPEDEAAFFKQVKDIAATVEAGEAVLIHCAAGIGRTGLFASCLLQALGVERDDAIERVKVAGSGAETKIQRDLISRFR